MGWGGAPRAQSKLRGLGINIPLTEELKREAATYGLRSSCVHCRYYVEADGSCMHGWPNEDQRRWPWEPPEAHFCKEFELR